MTIEQKVKRAIYITMASEGVNQMGLLADRIERFIMRKLMEEQAQQVVLQRKEIADAIQCAPSQISYVLNTRFSTERGFAVESKRGLGGFIRITILETRQLPQAAEWEEEDISIGMIDRQLYALLQDEIISKREARLLHEVFAAALAEEQKQTRLRLVRRLQERIGAALRGEGYEM